MSASDSPPPPPPDSEGDLLVYDLNPDEDPANDLLPPPLIHQQQQDQDRQPPLSQAGSSDHPVIRAAAVAAAAAVVAAATSSAIMPHDLPLPEFPDDELMPAAAIPSAASAAAASGQSKRLRVDRSFLQQLMTPSGATAGSGGAPDCMDQSSSSPTITAELLQSLAAYIVKETSAVDEDVASGFLSALIPVGDRILSDVTEVRGFPDLMIIMITLAGSGSGSGHVELVSAICDWLEKCRKYLCQKDVIEKLQSPRSGCSSNNNNNNNNTGSGIGRHQVMLDSACYMMAYLSHVYQGLKILMAESEAHPMHQRMRIMSTPSDDRDEGSDCSYDRASDDNDEDTDDEDGSDADSSSISNKLCTFTVTQKEFMNQHWYHCHTCKMTDRVGVCTVCAKVCHKDHDVTYAKYGSFFCDCGAREDGACIALVRRPVVSDHHHDEFRLSSLPNERRDSRRNRRARTMSDDGDDYSDTDAMLLLQSSSLNKKTTDMRHKQEILSHQLRPHAGVISEILDRKSVCDTVLSLMEFMSPVMTSISKSLSSQGNTLTCQQYMRDLHQSAKRLDQSDTLMLPTLGSQEGAFENVKLSYTGDQGHLMKQLISSHVIRRVAMCALTSPCGSGRRQHLAVSHEKGKITLLQLSALLKQADSSKRKLTLTRLASAPVPFVALSIDANPCHEDLLAVCGLKDCHVLTFSNTGTVTGHLMLLLQLESGNHVIKSHWLPGEQTVIAVVTSDFVKVYDLSLSATEPVYFFLPPSGKVRDVTFCHMENGVRIILMLTSSGYIYAQNLNAESQNGPFYVTNVLEVKHEEICETSNGIICNGGVAIYYSHSMQMLFVSYGNGKALTAAFTESANVLDRVFLIEIRSPSGSSHTNNNPLSPPSSSAAAAAEAAAGATASSSLTDSPLQVLTQWREVAGHPGLVLAMSQQTNNPIILLIKPEAIVYQEIKFLTSRAKITDIVAVRHATGSGDMRTTLILLCEDGSLRIFMSSRESTDFWIKTVNLSPSSTGSSSSSSGGGRGKRRNRKLIASNNESSNAAGAAGGASASASSPSSSFPVDFFESCTHLTEIEFGGSDVLQVYNTQQLKNRLQTPGMYIASTKSTGFTVDVINHDSNI